MMAVTGATVVGSLGKMSNTLNKGIIAVSMDRDYIRGKEISDAKNKPKTTMEGLGQGVKGLSQSVFSGVTGVFTKPVEGARSGGF
jgi:vacuolar protein sorting-associated protein 13A/C